MLVDAPRGEAPADLPPPRLDVSPADLGHLARAVVLGRRGWGRVHPNPGVGCVLVRDGSVVAEGWHEEFGGPHAEARALEEAGVEARGATAYVSLEPCRHTGKTPACTDALRRAGVARVVYAAADPTPEAGGGGAELARSGLDVTGPVFGEALGRRENPAFFHAARDDARPFLALKLAVSLDGRIAAREGERTVLSAPEAAVAVQRLRAGHDAILVGGRTARIDDPRLTVRGDVEPRTPPARVALVPEADLPSDAALFREDGGRVVLFVAEDAPEADLERLEGAGAAVHPVPRSSDGLDLRAVLGHCRETGLRSVLCEGGGRLARSLLRGGLVGRLHLLVSPTVLGAGGVPAFPGPWAPGEAGPWAPAFTPAILGPDVHLVYDPPVPGAPREER